MDGKEVSRIGGDSSSAAQNEEEMDLRRGPWTDEEDLTLVNYISVHGEGRWNSLARCAGLKRTGKSCRLRWLNYLRPDVRRGNITLEEQFLILELHSRWGNRWSKIAQYFPGRTDNEIKNYWRTRVQKHAKQLKCDVNSKQFKDAMRYRWMPRLLERIQATTTSAAPIASAASDYLYSNLGSLPPANFPSAIGADFGGMQINPQSYGTPENSSSSGASSSESFGSQFLPPLDMSDYSTFPASYNNNNNNNNNPGPDHCYLPSSSVEVLPQPLITPSDCVNPGLNFPGGEQQSNQWFEEGYESENLWNVDDIWLLQQQLSNNSL